MLTKLPDYVISDCGYPNWNTKIEKLDLAKVHENLWSTSSMWSTRSGNFGKLLPLRETLSDYYMEKLMLNQSESMYKTTARKLEQNCSKNSSNNGKQALRHVNEILKNNKRQKECTLDKRSFAINLDKDLDQF